MRNYVIRDENGGMIGKVSGRAAAMMLQVTDGFWREYDYGRGKTSKCFEVTENCKFGISQWVRVLLCSFGKEQ